MSRNDLLRKKYAYIKNNYPTLPSNEISKMTFWGWERIKNELALSKPSKKEIELKRDFSDRELKRASARLEYLDQLKKAKIKDEITGEKYPQFDAQTRIELLKFYGKSKTFTKDITGFKKKNQTYTHDRWVAWSDSKNKEKFPIPILAYIHGKNLKNKVDINNSYGFAYTYYRLVMRFSDARTKKLIEPDPLSREGLIYIRVGATFSTPQNVDSSQYMDWSYDLYFLSVPIISDIAQERIYVPRES